MASIQCVKGRWYGRYSDPESGKRRSVPLGRDRASAEAWKRSTATLEQAARRLRDGSQDASQSRSGVDGPQGSPTVAHALRAFLAFLEPRVRPVTLEQYRKHHRALARLLDGCGAVSAFGSAEVDAYVRARLAEGVDPRTIAKEQAFLRRFVRFLHERWPEAVPRDWSGASALKPLPDHAGGAQNRSRRAQRPVLDAERIRALLDALPPATRLGARVRFLLCCPIRPVEMLRLRVADVDLDSGVLRVTIRKNGRAGGERIEPYPIVPRLVLLLREAVRGKHPEALVFPGPGGNRPQDTGGLCHEWARWRRRHPEFADVQLYALRRTVGTAADRTAKNAFVAMAALNHRTWAAHQRYSELGTEDARQALTDALKSVGLD